MPLLVKLRLWLSGKGCLQERNKQSHIRLVRIMLLGMDTDADAEQVYPI